VNVAARVGHLTRETGDAILITEATRSLMVRGRTIGCEFASRGEFALKGVSEPVPIYTIPTILDKSSNRVQKTPQARV
jgi:class 3 adenylate cyclase